MSSGGFNSGSLPPWVGQLAEKAAQPGFERWRQMVEGAGGCTAPIRLVGNSATIDADTGEVLDTYSTRDEPTEYLLVACGNRRASRCEPCARVYADDTFHLIRSGLVGGRDIPSSVATHPIVFATFTAPSFGAVHTRVTNPNGVVKPCRPRRDGPSCTLRHPEGDSLLGQALDSSDYDYAGAVLWNNRAGELWHMFMVYLRRNLAEMLGVSRSKLPKVLRVEYAKVAEYQTRGVVHFHAVIRLDGPEGPDAHPPIGVDTDVLREAIIKAARTSRIVAPTAQGEPHRLLRWGTQLDLRPVAMDTDWTDQKVARYIAKYATKGAEAAGTVNRPLRGIKHLNRVKGLSPQARNMIEECWRLGGLDELASLKLRQWAHMLGYGGHFSTKSRQYSTTLRAIQTDRAEYRAHEAREAAGVPQLPDVPLLRVGSWRVAGTGYVTPAEETWAEAIRDQRRRRPIRRRGTDASREDEQATAS
jgi:replication initiator protein RepSA